MTNESTALAVLSAVILALSLLAAMFWMRERRSKEEARRRAYRHGLAREADRRSHAVRSRAGRDGPTSSPSGSDAGHAGAFAFPGLGDSDFGRSDHSDTSSSHSSCSSSSCSSSSCGGGGGD